MLELRGKYATAKVFTDNVESEAISQIINLCNQEFAKDSKVRIMPDTHAGKGCVIGFTMEINDKIVPNLVGVDIGCGMLTIELGDIDIDMEKLDGFINNNIPSGFSWNSKAQIDKESLIAQLKCLPELTRSAEQFNLALGTLGGGNHFIEINEGEKGKYLVIHSGSRNLGHQVATYYQNVAIQYNRDLGHKIPDALCYLEYEAMKDYLYDMNIVQQYAEINRDVMARRIVNECLGLNYDKLWKFQTIHNYINMNDNVLRKGAISAKEDEVVLIPINMRDGSLLCIGKGNEDWNNSAPHGAGRIMSRSKAKRELSIDDFTATMSDVYTTSVHKSTLDEAPMAYKPIEEIVANVQDTVEIIDTIKPIYNFKAH